MVVRRKTCPYCGRAVTPKALEEHQKRYEASGSCDGAKVKPKVDRKFTAEDVEDFT